MQPIGILGGAGFIGSHVTQKFLRAGYAVRVDTKLMFPNGPAIVGRKNIQTALHNVFRSGITKAEFTTTDVWGTPAFGSEEGQSRLFDKAGTQVVTDKYIVLWKKEAGKWMPFRDISNSVLPALPAK